MVGTYQLAHPCVGSRRHSYRVGYQTKWPPSLWKVSSSLVKDSKREKDRFQGPFPKGVYLGLVDEEDDGAQNIAVVDAEKY